MSYANQNHQGMSPAPAVPFSEFTAPMEVVGQNVYLAFAMAAKGVTAVVGAVGRAARRHQAQSQLMSLDDRTLRDIGVSRSEIRYIAKQVSDNPSTDYRRHSGL